MNPVYLNHESIDEIFVEMFEPNPDTPAYCHAVLRLHDLCDENRREGRNGEKSGLVHR